MTTPDNNPDWVSTADAARYLGLRPAAVMALINDGDLRAYRPGKRSIRIRRPDLEAYLESRVIKPGSLAPTEASDEAT